MDTLCNVLGLAQCRVWSPHAHASSRGRWIFVPYIHATNRPRKLYRMVKGKAWVKRQIFPKTRGATPHRKLRVTEICGCYFQHRAPASICIARASARTVDYRGLGLWHSRRRDDGPIPSMRTVRMGWRHSTGDGIIHRERGGGRWRLESMDWSSD